MSGRMSEEELTSLDHKAGESRGSLPIPTPSGKLKREGWVHGTQVGLNLPVPASQQVSCQMSVDLLAGRAGEQGVPRVIPVDMRIRIQVVL